MPCDQVRTTTINLQAASLDLLARALSSLGYRDLQTIEGRITGKDRYGYRFSFEAGKFVTRSPYATNDIEIKRQYAKEAVKLAAKKFAWTMKPKGQNSFVFSKRAF